MKLASVVLSLALWTAILKLVGWCDVTWTSIVVVPIVCWIFLWAGQPYRGRRHWARKEAPWRWMS